MKTKTSPLTEITITVKLAPKNAATLAWLMDLTGLPADELINFCLGDYLPGHDLEQACDDSFTRETVGLLKFKTREDAERVVDWVKASVRKGERGKFPIVETKIRELKGGRFEVDVFSTWKNGETRRVC